MKFHQWVFKILKKQNVTDGRTDAHTDAQMDGQRENSIPPLKLRFGGGYNYNYSEFFTYSANFDFHNVISNIPINFLVGQRFCFLFLFFLFLSS